jgi:hypothetical protein
MVINNKLNKVIVKQTRPRKVEKFAAERKIILDKLLTILGINKENPIFYFEDLDETKQLEIMNLKDDVKKYFKSGAWSVFTKYIARPHLSLCRSILKASGLKTRHVSFKNSKTKLMEKQGLLFI